MFIGRENEMALLASIFEKHTASLVICRGRRRIGKSTLIENFGKRASHFYEFQGLPPRPGLTNRDQLDHTSRQIAKFFSLPNITLNAWSDVFALLARETRRGKTIIFLDEISWMAFDDPDFVGALKIAWDTLFKKNPHIMLVLCGSVTSWIDNNILNNAGFVGRVSLILSPEELPLYHCNEFWGKKKNLVSGYEKLKLLAITGGVPRYLEEISPGMTAEENIKRLCFSKEGFLFDEFDRIFNDIFAKRAPLYKEITRVLVQNHARLIEICKKISYQKNGVMGDYLDNLVKSGFIDRDVTYKFDGKPSQYTRYRLKDNYLRFYLHVIEPEKDKILKGLFRHKSLENLPGWESLLGLQFENLILANRETIIEKLNIPPDTIISASPYFQAKTQRHAGCQIDFLIDTRHTLYVGETKFRKLCPKTVIDEVKKKIAALKPPKFKTIRPFLVYGGVLEPGIAKEDFFNNIISFEDLLNPPSSQPPQSPP